MSKDLNELPDRFDFRFVKLGTLGEIFRYIRKHDEIEERQEHNYVSKIARETQLSKPTVIKSLDFFEDYLDLIERVENGRKNTIRLKVTWKS